MIVPVSQLFIFYLRKSAFRTVLHMKQHGEISYIFKHYIDN